MLKSHFHGSRCHTAVCGVLLLTFLATGLTACSGSASSLAAPPADVTKGLQITPKNGSNKADPNKPVQVSAKATGIRITDVTVVDSVGRVVRGELGEDGGGWHSTAPLAAGVHYTVRVSTAGGSGKPGRGLAGFTTTPVDNLLRAKLGPEGSTFGVGEPVTVQLSHPITDPAARALVESALKVSVSVPGVFGRWHWVDDRTLHYRTNDYWPSNATVTVESRLRGIRIQQGLYGGPDQGISFRTGDRVEAVVDAAAHRMEVMENGEEVRTIPVTTGKPGFSTRNGIKVILAKEPFVRMRGTTVGIAAGSSDAYDLGVYWATRVTWSGEYVHAAPWSVGSQGSANVSHGCTGMSMANAKWFFDFVQPGDIVEVINSQGKMMTPFDNGFGDWNLSWDDWGRGSALHGVTAKEYGLDEQGMPDVASARLTPQT